MKKTPIYFVPGLAAGPEIFENLDLDPDKYTLHFLEWIKPLALKEDIGNYAYRLSNKVTEKEAVLIGVLLAELWCKKWQNLSILKK